MPDLGPSEGVLVRAEEMVSPSRLLKTALMLVAVRSAEEVERAAKTGADIVALDVALQDTDLGTVRRHFSGEIWSKGDAGWSILPLSYGLESPADPEQSNRSRRIKALPLEGELLGAVADNHAGDILVVSVDRPEALFRQGNILTLEAFAEACRQRYIHFGFVGALESPDISRLLLLKPDILGVDRAVRIGHVREGALDPVALDEIRALIPRAPTSLEATAAPLVLDRLFVRDFLVTMSIGAYRVEREAKQRVRFSVDVELLRDPTASADMRGIFSYDIIIDTIRMLADRTHVAFVETLAEQLATALLEYRQVRTVTITVEKLDVIDGAVGITIRRPAATS